jgi:hypothetical protein
MGCRSNFHIHVGRYPELCSLQKSGTLAAKRPEYKKRRTLKRCRLFAFHESVLSLGAVWSPAHQSREPDRCQYAQHCVDARHRLHLLPSFP